MSKLDSKTPSGPLAEKWSHYKSHANLVNPSNKRKLDIIVVGTGLAGAAAAASLGEMDAGCEWINKRCLLKILIKQSLNFFILWINLL